MVDMFGRSKHPRSNDARGPTRASCAVQTLGLELDFAELSDRGPTRDQNQDSCGHWIPLTAEQARTHGWLFALADGVGGQALGDVASRLAIQTLTENFQTARDDEPRSSFIARLIRSANSVIYEAGHVTTSIRRPMATTVVTCALRLDRAVVAHVGDSRCYQIRRGRAKLLTRDHTVAAEQVRLGVLSAHEAASSPSRHLLSRSLGGDLFVAVDMSEHLLMKGDVLLLCSDGLHASVLASEMAHAVTRHENLHAAAQELVSIANARDGSDNVTIQLIRIRNVERVGMYRGRPYQLR